MKRDEYDRSSHGTAKPDPAIGPRARVDDLGADPRLSSGPQRPSRAAHKGRTHDRTRNQVVTSLQFFLAMQEPSTHDRAKPGHDATKDVMSSPMKPVLAVVLMTGTVLDGNIDLALIRTDGEEVQDFGPWKLAPYAPQIPPLLAKAVASAREWKFEGAETAIFREAEEALTQAQSSAVSAFLTDAWPFVLGDRRRRLPRPDRAAPRAAAGRSGRDPPARRRRADGTPPGHRTSPMISAQPTCAPAARARRFRRSITSR